MRLNPTDRDPDIIVREYDRLAADLAIDFGGIRSDVAVMPGSGVFYFEGHRLSDTLGPYGVGVCSGTYPLDGASGGGGVGIASHDAAFELGDLIGHAGIGPCQQRQGISRGGLDAGPLVGAEYACERGSVGVIDSEPRQQHGGLIDQGAARLGSSGGGWRGGGRRRRPRVSG